MTPSDFPGGPGAPGAPSVAQQKVEAARELLTATKRSLQLVDQAIERLQGGRIAVQSADDVSSEHRAMWLGAVDDGDLGNGILVGTINQGTSFGWNYPKRGTIRNTEDAAFVCTGVLVAMQVADGDGNQQFIEGMNGESDEGPNPWLRLVDGDTGRNLITGMTSGTFRTGMTVAPVNLDLGAVPFSYISSIRPGLGSNIKNKLFSEFTIPRAGVVRAEVYNLGLWTTSNADVCRAFVSLLGYKVYGA